MTAFESFTNQSHNSSLSLSLFKPIQCRGTLAILAQRDTIHYDRGVSTLDIHDRCDMTSIFLNAWSRGNATGCPPMNTRTK